MKFAYRFANLLGTVYRKGNLTFTPDDNCVISPVGNRLTIFDLKNNKSETLPLESSLNITSVALAPDGNLLIAVNEEGEALLASVKTRAMLHRHHFRQPVRAISFSPDGKKFAVTKGSTILLYYTPGKAQHEFNPFTLQRTFYGAYDDNVSIDWTTDSSAFCVGCKDMNTRVYGAQRYTNLIIYSIGGHTDSVVNAFFEDNSLDVYSVSRNGQLGIWECDTDLDGLVVYTEPDTKQQEEEEEDQEEEEDGENEGQKKDEKVTSEDAEKTKEKILYTRRAKHNYKAARGVGAGPSTVTSACFNKKLHLLVTGFQDGAFFLHEMPDFNLIHSLNVSEDAINAISCSSAGDWIALGCSGRGQLLVWEWQSETYVMKQQGHADSMTCMAYGPDGRYTATGADDGKVKVWDMSSGFCFVTFTEHSAAVTDVAFSRKGQVIVSSSLDGTVRAFDLNRYRNFRTFASPRPVQFSCLALDCSDEVVCAGARDSFEIFVWSMKMGRLLDVLSGHEGPVSCLAFSSAHSILASGSWDKTVKLWDVFDNKAAKETLTLMSDVLAISYRGDGAELAVATLNAQISFWDVHNAVQTGSIEGRHDLGYSRKDADKITAKKSAEGKAFEAICYTADGKCILAGGKSKNVCIYSVADQILVKKFEITCNRSLDGTQEFIDRRKMTEWGNLALVDEADDENEAISLPGVRHGDMSSRHWKPQVRVTAVQFSPTGRDWAATSTEGLLVYSLDTSVIFDPVDLEMDITPTNVRKRLAQKDFSNALILALRLNEQALKCEVIECIPIDHIELVARSLAETYVQRLLSVVASQLDESRHLEVYLRWSHVLLLTHANWMARSGGRMTPGLLALQRSLTRRYADLSNICDRNKYTIQYVLALAKTEERLSQKKVVGSSNEEEEKEEKMDADESDDSDTQEMLMSNFNSVES